jgi:hypothetical protein
MRTHNALLLRHLDLPRATLRDERACLESAVRRSLTDKRFPNSVVV